MTMIDAALAAVRFGARRKVFGLTTAGIMAAAFALAPLHASLAEDRQGEAEAAEAADDATSKEPMTLIVSLDAQKVDIYRGMKLITSSNVSTGMRGYTTKSGVFTVLEKRRRHFSNLYNGAPMPWMQRLTWSGTAIHAGALPGYPASHGCIRLPHSFAPKLFEMTEIGEHVVISRNHPKPRLIEHSKLFQPLPMPAPPVVSDADRPNQKAGLNQGQSLAGAADAASPLVLASTKVTTEKVGKTTPESNFQLGAAKGPSAHAPDVDEAARTHAVSDLGSGDHAVGPRARTGGDHAISEPASRRGDHAITVDHPLSFAAEKLNAGGLGAAAAAAEPRNEAPLRVLITKATKRDRIRGVQFQLADLGYLEPQRFDGTFGTLTVDAIKRFQRDRDMPPSGAVTDDVVKAIYEANGEEMPPEGHLFVRREFEHVYDVPAEITRPEEDLGTHVFTALNFSSGDASTRWMAISTNDGDPYAALDRVVIPEEARQWISERLTPGSSLIIADTAINSAALPKGADFVVLSEDPGKPAARTVRATPRPRARRRAQQVQPQRRVQQARPRYQTQQRQRHRRPGGPFWLRW